MCNLRYLVNIATPGKTFFHSLGYKKRNYAQLYSEVSVKLSVNFVSN